MDPFLQQPGAHSERFLAHVSHGQNFVQGDYVWIMQGPRERAIKICKRSFDHGSCVKLLNILKSW